MPDLYHHSSNRSSISTKSVFGEPPRRLPASSFLQVQSCRTRSLFHCQQKNPSQNRDGSDSASPARSLCRGQAYVPGWYPRYHPGSRANLRPCSCRATHGALSTGGRRGAIPAAGVTVGQFGRSYWRQQVGVRPRQNCPTTFGRRLRSDIRSGPGARSHRTGLALPGALAATRLRLSLYIYKCMTSDREVPRAHYPSWLACIETATGGGRNIDAWQANRRSSGVS